ncbi:DeoR/GlpR family DNA-binding transcription regulator [Tropicimonas sp. TH_r6]|uniref:DeoR/GlpR family DNA-binding transcription regulator n=1 Tax=Tropicimonas sp. TH_r6 TaxID=3082085 RepID=UPI002954AEE7|nr:DeoR/GlpR family DNA-binding transcription regulator [Tropicimonas sp. TH_r6]MDV7142552.1 DeoR/GlpR family DNA-binding transcription regulator [Tropicimonas sp. TH_r6]
MLVGRMRDIVNRVDHVGELSVADLSEQFGVAVETIRRDLRTLEEDGYLRRTHGGAASIIENNHGSLSFGRRKLEETDSKRAIARQAVAMIRPDTVLMLDHSSSAWYLAEALPDIPLTVITNSVRIVFDLVRKPNIRVIGVGGEYYEKYGAFLGVLTQNQVQEFHADICFCSCAAYSEDGGAWDNSELNAGVKIAMARSAKSNVLLCDTSKFDRTAFALTHPPRRIDCVITETGKTGKLRDDVAGKGGKQDGRK